MTVSMHRAVLAAAMGAIPALSAAPALAQSPQVEQGRTLARQWCSGCHQVQPGDPLNEVAPSFATIAAASTSTPQRLRGWLSTEHPQMPHFNLSDQEINAIIAFLDSLRP